MWATLLTKQWIIFSKAFLRGLRFSHNFVAWLYVTDAAGLNGMCILAAISFATVWPRYISCSFKLVTIIIISLDIAAYFAG